MLNKTVVTENVQRTVAALTALEENVRSSPGRGLMLVDGFTGTGKTETLKWLFTNFPQTVLLHAPKKWSASWMVEDMCLRLGLSSRSIIRHNLRQLEKHLRERPCTMLIDEGDRVIRREELLETLRDVHDLTNVPIVLVAEGRGREALARKSERAWRRVSQVVEFKNLTVTDVQVMGKELALLDIPPAQAALIHEQAGGGVMGQVINLLEAIERLLKINPGQEITAKVLKMAFKARRVG